MGKGQSGIGTLIIFIAMILVAAVAAGVLVQTVGSIQSKALSTGSRAKSSVSTGVYAMSVEGTGDTGYLDQLYVTLRLVPGSDAIKVEDMLVSFMFHVDSQDYAYNTSVVECDASNNAAGKYNMKYVFNASNHREGYIQSGDVVQLCFNTPANINESTPMRLSISPKSGNILTLELVTPDLLVRNREYLFP